MKKNCTVKEKINSTVPLRSKIQFDGSHSSTLSHRLLHLKLCSVNCIPYFMSAYFPCGVSDVSQLFNICRFVFPVQSKKVCRFVSTFPMVACSACSCCFNALCPVSEACNLIPEKCRSCSTPSIGTLPNCYAHCCKSLVTVDRRWTAVCRLLKLSWHFRQWLLHIDKSPPRRYRGQSGERRGEEHQCNCWYHVSV